MFKNRSPLQSFVGIGLVWLLLLPDTGFWAAPLWNVASAKPASVGNAKTASAVARDQSVRGAGSGTPSLASANGTPCIPLTHPATLAPQPDPEKADFHAHKWGSITFAAPKIWGYERVNTYLDGLLRDIEAVSLSDLTQLDPNAQNAGAIQFIQSALEVGVQYNQASTLNNNLVLQSWQTSTQQQLQQLQQYNGNLQALEQQRNGLIQQLASANGTINGLQQIELGGTTLTTAQSTQLTAAQAQVTTLNSELANVNSAISSAGAPPALPTPPTLQTPTVQGPASGTNMSSTFSGLSDLLSNLPSESRTN
jgi:hypothetical protein